jgi:hypothetical protein
MLMQDVLLLNNVSAITLFLATTSLLFHFCDVTGLPLATGGPSLICSHVVG